MIRLSGPINDKTLDNEIETHLRSMTSERLISIPKVYKTLDMTINDKTLDNEIETSLLHLLSLNCWRSMIRLSITRLKL